MLARIRKSSWRTATSVALLVIGAALSSCATKEKPMLVSDGRDGPESALPWNKQEKWEGQGQLGGMAERFNTR